jgi:hypothetical protein
MARPSTKHRGSKRGVPTLPPLPSLFDSPPEAQRASGHVTPAIWTDPEDLASNRRTAREIRGYRRACMVRWCRNRHGASSPFTSEHVIAADELRRIYDLARLGATSRKSSWIYIDRPTAPKLGPTPAELAGYWAWKEMRRVRSRFSIGEWHLLGWFVLENLSVGRWIAREKAAGRGCGQVVVMRQLVAMLDVLVEHFGDVIRKHGVGMAA